MKLITNNQALWKIITTLESHCVEQTINDVECVLELFTDTLYLTSYGDIYDVTTDTVYNFETPEYLFLSEIDISKIPTANGIITIYGNTFATLTWGTYIASIISKIPLDAFNLALLDTYSTDPKETLYDMSVESTIYSVTKLTDEGYRKVIGATNKLFSFDFSESRLDGKVTSIRLAVLPPKPIPVPEELFYVEGEELFYIPMINKDYFVGSSGKFYQGTREDFFFASSNDVITVEIANVTALMVDTWFLTAMASGRLRKDDLSSFVEIKPSIKGELISPTNMVAAISIVDTTPTLIEEPEFIIGAT